MCVCLFEHRIVKHHQKDLLIYFSARCVPFKIEGGKTNTMSTSPYIWFWYVLVPLVCKLKMFKPLVTIIFDRVSAPNVDPRQLSQTVACRPCFHWHKTNEKCRKFPAFSKRRCPRNNSKTLCFADWLSVTLSMMMQVVGVPAIQKKWLKWFLFRCAGEWTLDPAICCWPVKKNEVSDLSLQSKWKYISEFALT